MTLRFAASRSMAGYVGAPLREKIKNPLKFQWGTGGAEQPPSEINGRVVRSRPHHNSASRSSTGPRPAAVRGRLEADTREDISGVDRNGARAIVSSRSTPTTQAGGANPLDGVTAERATGHGGDYSQ